MREVHVSQIIHLPSCAKQFSPFFKASLLSIEYYSGKPKDPLLTSVELFQSSCWQLGFVSLSPQESKPGTSSTDLSFCVPPRLGIHTLMWPKSQQRTAKKRSFMHFTRISLIFNEDMVLLRDNSPVGCASRIWTFLPQRVPAAVHVLFSPQSQSPCFLAPPKLLCTLQGVKGGADKIGLLIAMYMIYSATPKLELLR